MGKTNTIQTSFVRNDGSSLTAERYNKQWRAVYVNSRSEKKVMLLLQGKTVEAYTPIVKTMKQWSDRKKVVEVPLLNGYVFVKISQAEQEQVLHTPGVARFVRSEGKIALVRDPEISRLKQLVELGYQLEVSDIDREIRSGSKVKIRSGVLNGLEGVVVETRDQRQLVVLLESIGQCVRATLPKDLLLPL